MAKYSMGKVRSKTAVYLSSNFVLILMSGLFTDNKAYSDGNALPNYDDELGENIF
jgi:hypothetical protein